METNRRYLYSDSRTDEDRLAQKQQRVSVETNGAGGNTRTNEDCRDGRTFCVHRARSLASILPFRNRAT